MNKKNTIKAIIILFLTYIILLEIFNFRKFKVFFHTVSVSGSVQMAASEEYLGLLKVRNNLEIAGSLNNKLRNTISTFLYNDYCIIVEKFPIENNSSLRNIISIEKKNTESEVDEHYSTDYSGLCRFAYRSDRIPIINNIQIDLCGNSFCRIKNDSIINYYLIIESLTIRYNNNKKNDIILLPSKTVNNLPLSLVYVKKGNNLYLIIMSIIKKGEYFDPSLLEQLINT